MALKVGELYAVLKLKTDEFTAGLRTSEKGVSGLSSSMGKLFGVMGGAYAIKKAGDFIWSTAESASNLAEATNKVNVVFGESAKAVLEFGASSSKSMGQANSQALEAAGTFGNLMVSMGFAEGQAADMSMQMVRLASDLASFNNTGIDEALTALRSGLVGETEPMKRFGVAMNQASLEAKALAMGIWDGNGALNAQQKMMAAYELIMADTTTAQGDFINTSDGMANSLKIASAEWENAKAAMGEEFMPIITQGAQYLADHAEGIGQGLTTIGKGFAYMAESASEAANWWSGLFTGATRREHEDQILELKQTSYSLGVDIGDAINEGLRAGEDPATVIEELLGGIDLSNVQEIISDGPYDWQTIDSNARTAAEAVVQVFTGTSLDEFGLQEERMTQAVLRMLAADPTATAQDVTDLFLEYAGYGVDEGKPGMWGKIDDLFRTDTTLAGRANAQKVIEAAEENLEAAKARMHSLISSLFSWGGGGAWQGGGVSFTPHAADGGILSGPSSGYLAVLHGTEEVRPLGGSSSTVSKQPLGSGGGIDLSGATININQGAISDMGSLVNSIQSAARLGRTA